jgi:hypothetical protein
MTITQTAYSVVQLNTEDLKMGLQVSKHVVNVYLEMNCKTLLCIYTF